MRKYGAIYVDVYEVYGLLFDHIKSTYGVEVHGTPEVDVDFTDDGELLITGFEFNFEEDK